MTTTEFYNSIKEKLFNEHVLCDVTDNEVTKVYPLIKITDSDLKELRSSGKPGFVFKYIDESKNPEYWYTEIPKNFKLVSKKWLGHICGTCQLLGTMEGSNLSKCAWAKTIKQALRIEEHKFLRVAAETFNTKDPEVLKISACKNFSCSTKKDEKKLSIGARKFNALRLAQHLDPSLQTVEDLKRYEEKYLLKK